VQNSRLTTSSPLLKLPQVQPQPLLFAVE
jgi:hypothetical protein